MGYERQIHTSGNLFTNIKKERERERERESNEIYGNMSYTYMAAGSVYKNEYEIKCLQVTSNE